MSMSGEFLNQTVSACDSCVCATELLLKLKMKLNMYFVLKTALVLFCALGVGDCGIMTDYFRRLNKEWFELVLSLQITE